MTWILFKCRKCGAMNIARAGCATSACKVEGCKYRNKLARVVVVKRFETFEEASDALRFIKLPRGERDPAATDLYQSSAWRGA